MVVVWGSFRQYRDGSGSAVCLERVAAIVVRLGDLFSSRECCPDEEKREDKRVEEKREERDHRVVFLDG